MTHQHPEKKAQQQRDDLTGEHTFGDTGQTILACLFAATWIADTFFLKYTAFLNRTYRLAPEYLLESFC